MPPLAKRLVLVLLPAALLVALASGPSAAPLPKGKAPAGSGVLVLDDCDQAYQGKLGYEDNLSYFDAGGKLAFRVSGFNTCEAIGSSHMVAVDAKRGWAWALEHVGHRVRKFDRKGKQLLAIDNVKGNALAVDPETGNLWVLTSNGTIHGEKTVVYDAKGKEVARHDVSGWDIVYDPKGKAFWIAGKRLIKLDAKTGKVAFNREITAWCSSSVAVCPETGKVWATARRHPDVRGSKDQLLGFDNDGTPRHTIDLGDEVSPFCVSVGEKGAVWVTLYGKSVRRYSAKGKLEAELKHKAIAAAADPATGGAWVVTQTEVLRVSADGKVQTQAKHRGKTTQAWVVCW